VGRICCGKLFLCTRCNLLAATERFGVTVRLCIHIRNVLVSKLGRGTGYPGCGFSQSPPLPNTFQLITNSSPYFQRQMVQVLTASLNNDKTEISEAVRVILVEFHFNIFITFCSVSAENQIKTCHSMVFPCSSAGQTTALIKRLKSESNKSYEH
jgi:hypothetical protein